jgi:hypothetical protein
MNRPETYNKAVIPNSSVMADELNTNSPIAIDELQDNDNQTIINSTIMIAELQDCKIDTY